MTRFFWSHRTLLCAGIAALLYLTGLGRPALWEPDEGRYAEVAREMVVNRDYVTPRNDWVRYFEKPPLVYWATAAAIKILGPNEFAVRLQAALASVGQVAITEALGEAMFGATAGVMGALALALSPLFFGFARFATPDPALAFFLTAALASFYAASRAPDFRRGRGRHWMVAAAVMLALGTLAKGPVALVLGGAIALLWLIAEGRWRDALRMPWLECVIAYATITLPWFVAVAWRNPGFPQFFFVHEHLQRYLENTEHGWGPWFFIPIVIGGTWPWLFFVPFGFAGSPASGETRIAADTRSAARLLLIWFAVIFIFFSIPRSKLGEYILPALPSLAIIAGLGLANLTQFSDFRRRRILGILVAINAAIPAGVAIAIAAGAGRSPVHTIAGDALAGSIALVMGSVAAYLFNAWWRTAWSAALALGVVLAMASAMKAREDAAPMFSYRRLARAIAPYTSQGCTLASYHHIVQAMPFYTGVREMLVGYRGELAPFGDSADAAATFIATDAQLQSLWNSQKCVVLIINQRDMPKLAGTLDPIPSILECEGKKLALYNRPIAHELKMARECGDGRANKKQF